MEVPAIAKIDLGNLAGSVAESYANFTVSEVNDHVVRLSVMTGSYDWHFHPNSDETFMTIEGILLVDLETETIELLPGELLTIPRNIIHRTRPKNARSVNITVEHRDMETVIVLDQK
ncbi:cupin domain-containing protein [Dyadobacter sp.]|uniref:cupin domain-containing protein n=1 Tax=Dyadobacter sp. TaxID=1914288 RepID=UPI003F718012